MQVLRVSDGLFISVEMFRAGIAQRPETRSPGVVSSMAPVLPLSHRSPDFLGVLTGKRHVILCGGTAFEIEMQEPSSKMGFPDEIKVDRDFTRTFFVFHFHESHRNCLPV